MFLRYSLRTATVLLLCLAIGLPARGQTTVKAPGSGKAIALVAASVAIFVVVVYSVFHKHKGQTGNQPSFVGCTEVTDHGLVFTDEKDGQDYVILSGIAVKAGERVEVLATKDEDDAGRLALHVGKLVKDYGPCKTAATPAVPAQPH